MNASSTALVFVGLLLTLIGLFVAGNIVLIALGVASAVRRGLLPGARRPACAERDARRSCSALALRRRASSTSPWLAPCSMTRVDRSINSGSSRTLAASASRCRPGT